MMFRRLFLGSVSTAAYRVMTMVVALFLTPFLVRSLGSATYGLVALLMVFTMRGYGSIADLGIASSVTKYTAAYSAGRSIHKLRRILDTSFVLYSAIGLLLAVALWVAGNLAIAHLFEIAAEQRELARRLLAILAITTLIDFPGAWFGAVLEGYQRYDIVNGVQIVRTLVSVPLIVLLVSHGYGAEGWLMAVAVAAAASYVAYYLSIRRLTRWGMMRVRPSRVAFQRISRFSAKVFILQVTSVLYHNVDRTLLGIFRRVDALTVYDIAFRIHSLAAAPLGFTTTLALPAAASLDASDRPAQLRELFLRGTLYTIAIAVPAAVIILVMAPEFLHAWLGPEFAGRSLEVRLFVSYLIVWCVPQVGWNMMIGLDRTARLLPVNLTSVAINVCVSAALVGRFGVAGVIAGTVAGNLVATPWYVSIFLRELNISVGELARTVLLRTYPQAIAVGLALMWIVRLVRPESLLAVGSLMAAAYAAYAALFWVTGIDAVDRARFQSLVRRRLVA